MKKSLFDEITEGKIRTKTADQAIAKTFRLDRLDQIAAQTKPKPKPWFAHPRINAGGDIGTPSHFRNLSVNLRNL